MDMNVVYNSCTAHLREFARSAGFGQVVLGLSGGLDSSVTATLCVHAFGAACVHGVMLPGPYSSEHSLTDARDLAACLNIETHTVSITDSFSAVQNSFAHTYGAPLSGVAAQNTQARLRMVVLMALSNQHGWMLVNTGNKSEAMMGYSTLYGDTAGAYAPLGGLYKTQVFELARWLNCQAQQAGNVQPIPQHVLEKAPSAELCEGQEDETSLGIRYELLDEILIRLVEQHKTVQEVAAEGFEAAEVQRISQTLHSFAFKRALEPPFPPDNFYAATEK